MQVVARGEDTGRTPPFDTEVRSIHLKNTAIFAIFSLSLFAPPPVPTHKFSAGYNPGSLGSSPQVKSTNQGRG